MANPAERGLYDPRHEHDACGVGLVARISGQADHEIIAQGLEILSRLAHRGAVGGDGGTGDGAGISLQLHKSFLKKKLSADWCAVGSNFRQSKRPAQWRPKRLRTGDAVCKSRTERSDPRAI